MQSQLSSQPQIQYRQKCQEEKNPIQIQSKMAADLRTRRYEKDDKLNSLQKECNQEMSYKSKKQTQNLMEEQRAFPVRNQREEENCQIDQIQQFQGQIKKMEYDQLISYAKADGGFLFDEQVEKQINFEGWKNEESYPQNIWLTLLALLYLDQYCSQNRKSWQLVYQKGIQFLQRNGVSYKQLKEQLLKNIKQQI